MDTTRRLWLGLATLPIMSFGILLWIGRDMAAPQVRRA
jgi:hypothetical protein